MANSSSGDNWSKGLNQAISSFVLFEVLPIIAAITLLVIIVIGAVTHILIIISLKKAEKLSHPAYRIIFHGTIQDIAALILVAAPNFIASCVGDWPFKQGLCVLQGVIVTSVYIMALTLCVWMTLERCFKLVQKEWWKKVFEDNSGRIYIIIYVVQWILSIIYSVLPISGVSNIEYQKNGFQCDRSHSDSKWLMNVHFVFTYGIPFVICFVLFMILLFQRVKQAWFNADDAEILVSRRNSAAANCSPTSSRNELFAGLNDETPEGGSIQGANKYTRDIESSPDSYSGQNGHIPEPTPSTSSPTESNSASPRKSKHSNLVKVSKSMWDINRKADEHRLASTVMLTSSLIFLLWLPYVIVAYLYTYNDTSVGQWRGFYVIAMIFATVSYIIRPITYMIHNKSMRTDVRVLFPQKVMNKYHQYNDKRKEKMSAIRQKLALEKTPKRSQSSNGITRTNKTPGKPRSLRKKEKTPKGNLPSTPVEELEMSQFREEEVDRDELDDDDPWMSVIEQGSIPEEK